MAKLDGSCSGLLMGCQLSGATALERLNGAGGSASRKAHSHDCWQGATLPRHTNLIIRLCKRLNHLAVGFPQAYDTERKAETTKSSMTLPSKQQPSLLLYSIVPHSKPGIVWERTTQGYESQMARASGGP